MKIAGIIPARYASSRFPGKALADVNGKSMIQRVYEQSLKAKCLNTVIIATDDERILNHARDFGGNAIMTSESHRNGTERCFEVISTIEEEFDFVINIQGDEPYIDPRQIDQLGSLFQPQIQIATLARKINDHRDLFNPNINKVIMDIMGFAIYFSRTPIPYLRNHPEETWVEKHAYYKHIGIYGYKTSVLEKIVELPPAPLEIAESLEQLRWIENGYTIKVGITEIESVGVDTPEDLKRLQNQEN